MARVRGRPFLPLRAFIKESFGAVGWQKLLAELPPQYREIVDGLLLENNWYDRDLHTTFLQTAHRLFAGEMEDFARKMGQRSANYFVRFYLKPLLKLGGPMMVVKKGAALYRELFEEGGLEVIERREAGARLELTDPLAVREFCSGTFLGYCEEVIRLGGKEVVHVVQERCRFDGAESCVFDLEWK